MLFRSVGTSFSGSNARLADFDSQVEAALTSNDLDVLFLYVPTSVVTAAEPAADLTAVQQFSLFNGAVTNATAWGEAYQGGTGVLNLRRLNKRGTLTGTGSSLKFVPDALNGNYLQFVLKGANGATNLPTTATAKLSFALSTGLTVDSNSGADRKSTRLNSSHVSESRMPSSA